MFMVRIQAAADKDILQHKVRRKGESVLFP